MTLGDKPHTKYATPTSCNAISMASNNRRALGSWAELSGSISLLAREKKGKDNNEVAKILDHDTLRNDTPKKICQYLS